MYENRHKRVTQNFLSQSPSSYNRYRQSPPAQSSYYMNRASHLSHMNNNTRRQINQSVNQYYGDEDQGHMHCCCCHRNCHRTKESIKHYSHNNRYSQNDYNEYTQTPSNKHNIKQQQQTNTNTSHLIKQLQQKLQTKTTQLQTLQSTILSKQQQLNQQLNRSQQQIKTLQKQLTQQIKEHHITKQNSNKDINNIKELQNLNQVLKVEIQKLEAKIMGENQYLVRENSELKGRIREYEVELQNSRWNSNKIQNLELQIKSELHQVIEKNRILEEERAEKQIKYEERIQFYQQKLKHLDDDMNGLCKRINSNIKMEKTIFSSIQAIEEQVKWAKGIIQGVNRSVEQWGNKIEGVDRQLGTIKGYTQIITNGDIESKSYENGYTVNNYNSVSSGTSNSNTYSSSNTYTYNTSPLSSDNPGRNYGGGSDLYSTKLNNNVKNNKLIFESITESQNMYESDDHKGMQESHGIYQSDGMYGTADDFYDNHRWTSQTHL